MNAAIYLYDGYFETELSVAAMLFSKQNLFTLASDQDIVRCMDGKKIIIDHQVKNIQPEMIDVLIIPGGSPKPREDIHMLIRALDKRGAIIGGICGGVDYMARAGILENRRFTSYYEPDKFYDFLPNSGKLTYQPYESDRNVVSAKPEAYLEFALELYRLAGLLKPEAINNYLEWFKSPFTFRYPK